MHYKKVFIAVTAIFLLLSCSSGASNKTESSLLWKISGNGLQKPSYIFGTHHLVPISFLDSIPGIEAAFEETEQTVGELDMSNMSEMQMKIMGEGMLPPDIAYATLLSPEDTAVLDSMLRAVVGVGLDQLGQLKPAMLSNLISISLYQRYYPSVASAQNIDYYFQEEALKRSRPVVGLETAEDQIYVLLNSQSLERQAEMLICMVKHPEMLKEQMDEMQAAYHAQDIEVLRQLYEKEIPDDPCPSTEEEKNVLNGDRNRKWLDQLPSIMEDKSSFIAVGCLHLPGDDGLIEGLRELGYNVEAVK
ncbi:MAG: TraB/GumN family protein [Proteiniphilum sp.]|uniref:TraB/GumN family protein n=1 Tax=Proteiniphilum sp. TaxID=1926877 RepID=UPI002ABC81C4|nr:TraB/GumN family protein [Proteiniphilum sp.]MDY9917666.1 TraB/GumN family protein [Proteiniphilum sp.]